MARDGPVPAPVTRRVNTVELSNEFVVTAPVDAAWAVLTDLERIAPCLPGAQLDEVEGDEYRGTVRVKVGPITSQYKGTASFVSLDQDQHVAVLRATGRDTRGQGNATATVTARLTPQGDSTKVSVVTELDISGKVAQFGRGMLADISTKLLGQFAERLENDVIGALSGAESPASDEKQSDSFATASPGIDAASESGHETSGAFAGHADAGADSGTPGVRKIAPSDNAPVDLGRLAGPSMIKAIPIVGVVLLAAGKLLRRRKRRRSVD